MIKEPEREKKRTQGNLLIAIFMQALAIDHEIPPADDKSCALENRFERSRRFFIMLMWRTRIILTKRQLEYEMQAEDNVQTL